MDIVEQLKQCASELGFHLFGVTPAISPSGYTRLLDWIDRGYDGEMKYIAKRAGAYAHPRGVFPPVRSLVVLGFPYRTGKPAEPTSGQARISRYAWGDADYHDLIHRRLKKLKKRLIELHPDAEARGVVDSAPLLEREFAELAGLGWTGKNTLLINKWEGSYFFLACLLTDQALPADQPHQTDHCGTCQRCLDACPTDAFVEPHVLDSRRCISYLTIEHRGAIPVGLRQGIGDWLFGCDVCQDVCPWNRRGSEATDALLAPRAAQNPIGLAELFDLDEPSFRARFRKTPLWRSRRRGILRNAAICLGNTGDSSSIPALKKGLFDPEPLVRGASAWGLGEIGGADAKEALHARRRDEADREVLVELDNALALCKPA